MKKILLLSLWAFTVKTASAQEYKAIQTADRKDIHLSDSVIYFNDKPAAFFYTELNESTPHYNIWITGLDMKLLVEAQVVKFDAPVAELKPFYFYKIIFPNERDTFSIYHNGQAFTVELATILKDYKLIDGNKINRSSYAKFKKDYRNNGSLAAKMREFIVYLNESRYFNEQVIRDRTKPVTILNDRTIMQDGKKIGTLQAATDLSGGNGTIHLPTVSSDPNHNDLRNIVVAQGSGKEYLQVLLPTGKVVDASKFDLGPKGAKNKLFEVSVLVNKEARNEGLLLYICKLIENYLL